MCGNRVSMLNDVYYSTEVDLLFYRSWFIILLKLIYSSYNSRRAGEAEVTAEEEKADALTEEPEAIAQIGDSEGPEGGGGELQAKV